MKPQTSESLHKCQYFTSVPRIHKVVRELYGILTAKKAQAGILVTFGNFTQDAKEFARGKPIDLIAGKQLEKLISEVQKSGNISATDADIVSCPDCGNEMVLRVAKKGKYAGQKFWGCTRYPDCRGLLAYQQRQ